MKKYTTLFLKIFSIVVIGVLLFVFLGKSPQSNNFDTNTNDMDVSQVADTNLVSGPEINLPWDFELKFIKSKEINNTPVLMGHTGLYLRIHFPVKNSMFIWQQECSAALFCNQEKFFLKTVP